MSAFNIINDIAVSPWSDSLVLREPSPRLIGGPDVPCLAKVGAVCKSWTPQAGELIHSIRAVITSTQQHGAPLTVMYEVSHSRGAFRSLHPSMEAAKAAVQDSLYPLHFSKQALDEAVCFVSDELTRKACAPG